MFLLLFFLLVYLQKNLKGYWVADWIIKRTLTSFLEYLKAASTQKLIDVRGQRWQKENRWTAGEAPRPPSSKNHLIKIPTLLVIIKCQSKSNWVLYFLDWQLSFFFFLILYSITMILHHLSSLLLLCSFYCSKVKYRDYIMKLMGERLVWQSHLIFLTKISFNRLPIIRII